MLRTCWLVLALGSVQVARAADGADAVAKDFPGWHLTSVVKGDLNGDGVPDAAAIAFHEKQAAVLIYLGTPGGPLRLEVHAPKATCVGCGGMKAPMDEALGELSLDPKGVLTITYMGGSREEWQLDLKWRWDSETADLVLIGETQYIVDTVGQEPEETLDINYSTLKADYTRGKAKAKRCAVPASFKRQRLRDFDFASAHFEGLSKLRHACGAP